MKPRIVWHYTYSHRINAILESGELLPPRQLHITAERLNMSDEEFAATTTSKAWKADEKLLLFSEREDWEPSSYRSVLKNGVAVPLLRLEDYKQIDGVYRIGVSTEFLKPYARLKSIVRMSAKMATALNNSARNLGANPFQWWGTVLPVPNSRWEFVQRYDFDLNMWMPFTPR